MESQNPVLARVFPNKHIYVYSVANLTRACFAQEEVESLREGGCKVVSLRGSQTPLILGMKKSSLNGHFEIR